VSQDVARVVGHLKAHGSAEHAAGVQWFFKEQVRSHGWYTAPLREYARVLHRELQTDRHRLVALADALFGREVLEEKVLAVLLLQRSLKQLGAADFRRFEAWLSRVASWADHDALTMYLIGPMMSAKPARAARVRRWAVSRRRWHRRAAAVSLIDGVRRGRFAVEATHVTHVLKGDTDDMVQKGLGWLLREWGKVRPLETVPLLMAIRAETSRLVLRTACERLAPAQRQRVLTRPAR
jgi:3-methyladenine DNA glycosylase AlkD